MPQRSVATNFTFEQQRQEINLLAADFWTQKGDTDTAAPTYLKHDGSNAFSGQTLNVPNAFTINANSGSGTLTISGNLDVTGTTTTVSTANLEVTDKNILIAKGSTSDAQADGAGITIDSATDITWNFVDANDALVSSIGVEATTHLKAARGQFIGATSPTTGSGVEINAPDANTGQIIAYNRGSSAYNELRLRGSSVGVYAGTSNALAGTFNSTGLIMELGKTIGIGDATGSQSLIIKAADPRILLTETTNNSNCYLDYAAGGILEISVDDNNVDASSKFQVRIDGAAAGLTLDSTGLTTTGDNPILELKGTASTTGNTFLHINANANHWCVGADNYTSQNLFVIKSGTPDSSTHTFAINPSGNVGIGSTNPTQPLTLKRSSSGQAAFGLRFEYEDTVGPTSTSSAVLVDSAGLTFKNYNSSRNFIFETGKLLLGTGTPNTSDCLTIMDPGNAFMSLRSDQHADLVAQHLDFIVGTANRASGNMVGAIRAQVPDNTTSGGTLKGELSFWTNSGDNIQESMTITSDGAVQKPKNPGFAVQATPTSTNFTNYNNSWHSFGTIHYNNGNHYDNASGRFTAPIDGYYFFTCGLWCSNSDDSTGSYVLTLLRENANGGGDITFAGASHRTQNNQLTCSGGIYMTAGQTVRIEFNGSITSSTPRNYFTGCLIG